MEKKSKVVVACGSEEYVDMAFEQSVETRVASGVDH